MTVEETVAELHRLAAEVGPDAVEELQEVTSEHRARTRRGPQRFVLAGPEWPEHMPRSYPQSMTLIEAEPPDAAYEPQRREGRWRCGSGEGCSRPTVSGRRGLCREHAEALQAIAETWGPGRPRSVSSRPKPATSLPEAVTIDPADIFDPGGRSRVPAEERARWASAWLHRIGRPVRRADFCRVAGVDPLNGSAKTAIALAEERRWITRGDGGACSPGDVVPDNPNNNPED